jgi:nucleoside phosphorylase
VSAKVLVCFALKEEAGSFQKLARKRTDVSILITGIGKKNSRRALLERLEELTPEFVLTCGFAGGLDPRLSVGDVVFATHDSDLEVKLVAANARAAKVHCSSRIATTVEEKAELRRATAADAVEMESAAFEEVCRQRGIRFAIVRVISDTANENLPLDFNQLSRPDWSLDYGKLAWAVVKSPQKVPALLRLQKHSNQAAARLAEVLMKVVAPNRAD